MRLVATSGSGETGAASPPSETTAPSLSSTTSTPRKGRTTLLYAGVVIVVAVVLVVGYYAATGRIHGGTTGTSRTVLVPAETVYSIPGSQFDAIQILASGNETLNGTFYNDLWVILYVMTPAELEHLARQLVVAGYSWTSGPVANETITHLNLVIQPGPWDFVIYNPAPFNSTVIGFYTDLTLTS
jgi:hypothetical protein